MLSQNSRRPWECAHFEIAAAGRASRVGRFGRVETARPRAGLPSLVSRTIVSSLVVVIRLYRWLVSPLFGPTCRFHPTCSAYAIEAIRRYGPVYGSGRALARLARCHPWSDGGHDPVQ